MTRTLVASGFGTDGGGLFALGPAGFERIDSLETVGLAVSPDGQRLARTLVGYIDGSSPAHVMVYSRAGVEWYRRLQGAADPHGLVWTGPDELAIVSSAANAVIWLDGEGRRLRDRRFAESVDAWHLNCPTIGHDGQLVVSAFCRSDEVQGWRDSLRRREPKGRILGVDDGVDRVVGLTAPHDPLALPDGTWLVNNSATRELLHLDGEGRRLASLDLGGWTRGLVLDGNGGAWVGVSTRRHESEEGRARVCHVDLAAMEIRREWLLPSDEVFSLAWVDDALLAGLRLGFGSMPGLEGSEPPAAAPELRLDSPLTNEACNAFVACDRLPATVPAGGWFTVEIRIGNSGLATLTGLGDYPVRVGARWINEVGALSRVQSRVELPHPLGPGETTRLLMMISAPKEPGAYELRVALVQEGLQWFDADHPERAVTTTLDVTPSVASTPGGAPL